MFPEYSLILFGTALLISALGFYRFVWFMSVGYGFSVAGLGLAMLIIGPANAGTALCCFCLICYGIRLGGFLLSRELSSASYKKKLDAQPGMSVSPIMKCVMWLFSAGLYWCQTSPVWYRISNGTGTDPFVFIGAAVALCGIAVEAAADLQKSRAKKKNPGKPATEGLYRYSRCPNYFGEMLFWTGILISGIGAVEGLQWVPALAGWACIMAVMVSGAARLEKRQEEAYGSDPAYRAYAASTPILVPFLPVYSLTGKKG